MKQVVNYLSGDGVKLLEVPDLHVRPGCVLIQSQCSLVSSGTERTLVEFAASNLLDKAKQNPERVADVLDKIKTDGIVSTFESVKSKLDAPLSLGYCNVGVVKGVGEGVVGIEIGQRVASNGPHAEFVVVPQNLCAVIPEHISSEDAAFVVPSSIGLQGIRLADPTFGETFLVSGLGLIGILTCQLLLAQGCRVFGADPDPAKCILAEQLGCSVINLSSGVDPIAHCLEHTGGVGVDGVLITAATSSSEPVHMAAQACRQRGRIVLVGVTGLELRRDLFYKKELSFQVSCSYGPGRYDAAYEQQGQDYPIGFVRWTEQRNFQAVLQAMATGALRTDLLISHRFKIEQASEAYELLMSPEPSLGILLQYSSNAVPDQSTISLSGESLVDQHTLNSDEPSLGVIGSGNYASRILIPAFAKAGACFHSLAASSGVGPVHVGRKYGFRHATTDVPELLADLNCNTIVIATRHDSHAALVQQALAAGKHVFVEKPLCLTAEELTAIEAAYTGEQLLMVGFNRRFAPLLVDLREQLVRLSGPKAFVYTCNAGSIPSDHWTQDPALGGGRLLGEACHFVDLLRYLAASPIKDLQMLSAVDSKPRPDTFSLQLRFVDGSIGTVHYFANGSKSFPKERLEVFSDGKVLRLDNYRKLQAWGIPGFSSRRLLSQNKGQQPCCAAFLNAIQAGGPPPIPVLELFEVQRWLLEAVTK